MTYSTKIKRVITISFLILFLASCGPSNPVDKQLNKLESVIEKYEKKALKTKLTEPDIQKMQAELLSIGTKALGETTPAQEERFSKLGDRMDRLEANATSEE